ncbi:MAG TPA: AmmeMemoRadiSam system protein A [Blastocatellia bacterium]|nr:AmmeMemoRadiSam system protein A [Blastocatellia bacterium]
MSRPPDDITPPELARLAVEAFIGGGKIIEPPAAPQGVLAERAGVFVTLRTAGGDLRGCIGSIEPAAPTMAEEIIENAIRAATRDPRFPAVVAGELKGLTYGVDALAPPEPARGVEDLDPSVYGVIIETPDGRRRALLLPRIAGIDTAERQWVAVHSKAGIRVGAPVLVQRFTVTRYGKD